MFIVSRVATFPAELTTSIPPQSGIFTNPIVIGADPWFFQHDGNYVWSRKGPNESIVVGVTRDFTKPGEHRIVWRAPASGPCSREIWAPEIHRIGERWYIYFAASDGRNENHRMWVLESAADDPFSDYTVRGPIYTGDHPETGVTNRWAIDASLFSLRGERYMVWSGWRDERDIQWLYIARMKDPFTLATRRVELCNNDDYLWERVDEKLTGRGLHEGPQILRRSNRVFLIYSCSGSWQASYKLGLLELKPDGDPLNPSHWTKHPKPVFASTPETFGVGHNCFVKSPDGMEDWILYHSKLDRTEGWRRVIHAQPFRWTDDGFPDFGEPVARGIPLPLPSGSNLRNETVQNAN